MKFLSMLCLVSTFIGFTGSLMADIQPTSKVLLQKKFENYAWIRTIQTCSVLENGVVTYEESIGEDEKPQHVVKQLENWNSLTIKKWIKEAQKGKIVTEAQHMADFGVFSWVAFDVRGKKVALKAQGDVNFYNNSPYAKNLVKVLNHACDVLPTLVP